MRIYYSYHKFYFILFTLSLFIFLINFLVQGMIVFDYSDFYGLIFKLNWLFWLGYFILLILISFHFLKFDNINEKFVFLTFFLLIVYLIGTPFFLEHLPRFEDTWIHSYLPQQIFKYEHVNLGITIYEQYPGTFLFYGSLFQILPSYQVMKFFPPIFYIFGISVIYLLSKNLVDKKIAFLASIFYIFFNWTAEDNHISPQFLVLSIYFLFMLILIKYLKERKNRLVYFLILTLLTLTITFSHPLTPIFLIFILGAIVILCKKLRYVIIPILVLVAVVFIIYEIFETTDFVSISNFIRNFFEILTFGHFQNPTTRFSGVNYLYRLVNLTSKVSLTLFSVALGFFGIIILYKKKYKTEAKFFLAWAFALIPLMILLSQVLAGEFYERFALVSSLPLGFLASYFINKKKVKMIHILTIFLILSFLYFFAKHGNEAYQSESLEKLKVDCYSFTFTSTCEKNNEVVISSLDNFDFLGISHVGVSREEVMGNSIRNNIDVKTTLDFVENRTQTNLMDRYYSTNKAAVYSSIY